MNEKLAVIIGATGGIGSLTARRLAAEGWRVALAGRSQDKVESLAQEIGTDLFGVFDATSGSQMDEFFRGLETQNFERITAINCVGSILLKPAHLTSESELRSVIETNLFSAFNTVRNVAKLGKPGSNVVLVSSCAAGIGLANHEAIAAAKAGIEGLARSAAATYATKGIRVNVVAPGLVKTPLTERITNNAQASAYSLALHPLGRLGEAQDITEAILFLSSDNASWITGQVLGVDGGLSKLKL